MARPRYKLTFEQVTEIRAKLAAGELQVALAKEYGVTQATISRYKTSKLRITK